VLSIREGRPADIRALLEFWAAAGENAARPGDDAELVENLLRRDLESLLVAESAGAIIGTVIAGWDGWRAHLYRLAVDPDSRGRGTGRLLVKAAEDGARSTAEAVDMKLLEFDDVFGRVGPRRTGDRRPHAGTGIAALALEDSNSDPSSRRPGACRR